VSRRLVLLGLLAASQLSAGCFPCVRQRIAWRWQNCHAPVCAPACGPVCATPAFRIPSPVVGSPVMAGPVGGPGCSTCASGPDHGPVAYAVPPGGPISVGAPPIIGTPMPLGAPRIETPGPMPSGGVPKN
jgi:hypothetical protein